jgi:hypothetical protein
MPDPCQFLLAGIISNKAEVNLKTTRHGTDQRPEYADL